MENNFIEISDKLGFEYRLDGTIFRLWAPIRESVELLIYEDYRHVRRKKYTMTKKYNGVFEVRVEGDLHLKYYTFLIDGKYEVTDPYSIASSVNSIKSCVVDLEKTNPVGFKKHYIPQNDWKKAIIYETGVKDYSVDISSWSAHRGKFLGVVDDQSSFKGTPTGIRNIIDLGITHIHLMPVFDFLTVNEETEFFLNEDNYNWGYDPELYNNIEGSYSTKPKNPISRIFEFKQMIMKLHESNISVIMDVVYNHTYRGKTSNFNVIYPDYYYRTSNNGEFSNGSGCGNEIASERSMVRKFIVDSLKYYVNEYKIDGFRFDLMALTDLDTINLIVKELRAINPNIIIYGEPWMALDSPLPINFQPLAGSQKGKEFSVFNSDYRDALKGDNDGCGRGYIQGDYYLKNRVERGIVGSIEYDEYHHGICEYPYESINYFNSHDNLIIYDKILKTSDVDTVEEINKLVLNILFFSQGIPFIHSGNEFMRSKQMNHNSYNAPLSINGIDWGIKRRNIQFYNYVCELIDFRKKHDIFMILKPEEIRERVKFLFELPDGVISYTIRDNNEIYLIIHNALKENWETDVYSIKEHVSINYNMEFSHMEEVFNENGIVNNIYENNSSLTVPRLSSKVVKLS